MLQQGILPNKQQPHPEWKSICLESLLMLTYGQLALLYKNFHIFKLLHL